LDFGYTPFEPKLRKFDPVVGEELPATGLSNSFMELVDLHGAGLPDLLEMNGTVRYWRNLGGHFDLPRPMQEAPAHALADPGVQLLDANGNGRPDLMVTTGALAGFYPLKFDPLKPKWDANSFQPFKQVPSFNLEDPEVKLLDLDGDGLTDVLRSGSRFECFFNNPESRRAWERLIPVERKSIETFPNVSFSDPRVRLADMSGDGLQDILLVYDANIEYWPNRGHGQWGPRIHMRNSPRLPSGYDPQRVLVGDVDGDGLADILYVDDNKVCLWTNQSGNAWSDPIEIKGTPRANNLTTVRLVDLTGTGTAGVLWSSDAGINGNHHLFFLDLTGSVKPYLLNEMNNHMGGLTKVEYAASSRFYVCDLRSRKTRWKTPLPFPVQVVSRVEVIDDISRGKLTTEYRYHHGYWDGAEREFHGFGMVEQFDSESFEQYHKPGLHDAAGFFKKVEGKYYSPPTVTKTWFHQGAVGDEYGDWSELDLTNEYWDGDPPLLEHTKSVNDFLKGSFDLPSGSSLYGTKLKLSRRAKRDALRALRGSILRTELYALDGDAKRESRPYTVTEYSYGLREIAPPPDHMSQRRRIFFPHRKVQRVTQWERGNDPMTVFTFTDDYDNFGQPRQQTSVAMPRRAVYRKQWRVAVDRLVSSDETVILATHARTSYAVPVARVYLRDRVCETKSYELSKPPQLSESSVTSLQALLQKQFQEASRIHQQFKTLPAAEVHLIGHTLNYYDGEPFVGLPHAEAGKYGALTRTETLVFRDEELNSAYKDGSGTRRPAYLGVTAGLPNGAPAGFGTDLGYRRTNADGLHEAGYYADTGRQQFDFHVATSGEKRGLLLAQQDPRGNRTDITPDLYWLLPESVTDAAGLKTQATYNYRVLQPSSVTDPNVNVTEFTFSPIGLLLETWVKGQPAKIEGDRTRPSVKLAYDFLAHKNTESLPPDRRVPIFVHTTRRIHHDTDTTVPLPQRDEVIESREYSDGFGRLIQTRAQAEEWIFGDTGDDVGLPASQDNPTQPAVAHRVKDRVVVSGWQIYDNKGRVVEKYEPFFDKGWNFQREDDAKRGVFAQMFYDPRGQVIRTVNPDGSEQRVIFGRPADLAKPLEFEPTPWENSTYDPNDLAPLSIASDGTSLSGRAPSGHHFTPLTTILDALGRALAQIQRNGSDPANNWFLTSSRYDIRGNLLVVNDALGRDAFKHAYDLLNRPLRVDSIDAGLRTSVLDAGGNLVEYRDSKGSAALREYDRLNRLTKIWARNARADRLTLREHVIYGDLGDHAIARAHNQLGKPVEHRDEAGLLRFADYDFKGNLLEKVRQVISDTELAKGWQPDWDASTAELALDKGAAYQTTTSYDAFNRPTAVTYPGDVTGHRAALKPTYNRAGALEKIQLDDAVYVERIAYNARGQRVLIVYGNNVMTRYAYDPKVFRVARLRTEAIDSPGLLERIAGFFTGAADEITIESSGNVLQDFAYTYDLTGNIRAIAERVPNCGIAGGGFDRNALLRKFEYDPIYRLTKADGRACKDISIPRPLADVPRCGFYAGGASTPNQDNAPELTEQYTETYSYDPAGNMLELVYHAGANTWKRVFGMGNLPPDQWSVAPNNRLTSLVNGSLTHPYGFDDNGNLIQQDTDKHHTWDHADRMIGYRVQPNPSSPSSIEARYLYGADGMRVKKWVRKGNSAALDESAVYIDGIFEHHKWTQGGATKQNNHLHVMDNQSRIAIVRVGDKHPNDGGEKVQYHLGDHLGGSAVVIGGADSSESKFINREEYFPFGETSFGSFAKKRYRFSGKERDEESGLYYYGARFYFCPLSRWISCDPLGPAAGLNAYRYVHNSPLNLKDSLGLEDKTAQPEDTGINLHSCTFEESGLTDTPLNREIFDCPVFFK
jgi:RHS repeat-associated protein